MHDRHAVQYAYPLCRGGAAPEYPAVSRKAGIHHDRGFARLGRRGQGDHGSDGGLFPSAHIGHRPESQGYYRQRGDRRDTACPGVYNVPYGGCYYHSWYRDESITGGLFLQKATHDLDYIQYMAGRRPVELCAMESKQIFKGDKPAGLRCSDCPEERTCPESEWFMTTYKADHPHGDLCCFSTATGNHDSASVLVRYDTGMHVCYSQNFFARKNAQLRGARFLGYKGTLEFDWYTGEIHLHKHDEPVDACYKLDLTASSHFGGDKQLMLNFCGVMAGTENSESPLEDGIASALLCLKAAESAREHRFVDIAL